MQENSILFTCLSSTSRQYIISIRDAGDSLHDLCETHRFVDSRNRKCEILHHPRHPRISISYSHIPHQSRVIVRRDLEERTDQNQSCPAYSPSDQSP